MLNSHIVSTSLNDYKLIRMLTSTDIMFQGDVLYLFYETKNSITMQGDIGVAKSVDKGATWDLLGIALDENWHLSYPYVFEYLGQVSYHSPEPI